MGEAMYLVIFAPEGACFGELLYKGVAAHRFADVENWAFDNTPEGYFVNCIQKEYAIGAGYDIDVELREGR